MRRDTRKWSPKKSRLCSSHFEEDQFFTDKQVKRRLKDTAGPTIFKFPPHLCPKKGRNRATRTKLVSLTTEVRNSLVSTTGPSCSLASCLAQP
ncbi:hypothetical protein UPYG_G00037910, partial [Umbra pygmaea]